MSRLRAALQGDVPIRVRRVVELQPQARELFRRAFRAEPPDFPVHFVAQHPRAGIAGYVHYTEHSPGVLLCGGLCVDAGLYRVMPAHERDALRQKGSLSRMMLADSIAQLAPGVAVFAYTGSIASARDVLALGFTRVPGERYLYVRWFTDAADVREDTARQVVALGAF